MANTVRIKRRTSGAPGAPAQLMQSELAFNEVDEILYYGKGSDAQGNATSVLAIGGNGLFLTTSTNQTITGTKTFTNDFYLSPSTSKVLTINNNVTTTIEGTINASGILNSSNTSSFTGLININGGSTETPQVLTIGSNTNLMLNGSVKSSVTINGGSAGSQTNLTLGSFVNANFGSTLTVAGATTLNSTLNVSGVTSFSSNVSITGNLSVSGTLVSGTTVQVEDKNIELGNTASPTDTTASGGGITLRGSTNKLITYIDAAVGGTNPAKVWSMSENLTIATGKSYFIGDTKVIDGATLAIDNVIIDGGSF